MGIVANVIGAAAPLRPTIFRAKLAELALGALAGGSGSGTAFEAATGLRFTRASDGHTVQSSAATVLAIAAGNDRARVGQAGGDATRGLVLEEARTNHAFDARDMSASQWTAGTASPTVNHAAGPDGLVRACRTQPGASGYSNYHNATSFPGLTNKPIIISSWFRGTSGSCTLQSYGPTVYWAGSALTTTWKRFSNAVANGGGFPQYNPADFSGGPLVGQGAIDFLADLHQAEEGKFATEVIITTSATATRAAERLFHPAGASLVNAGRLGLELKFIPKGAAGDYGADYAIWYVDANNKAIVDKTTKQLTVTIGGATFTTTTALAWAAGDTVELWVEAGGGTLNTVVKSRVNGGSVTTHGTSGAAQGTLSVGSSLDLMCQGAGNVLTAWIQEIAAYKSDKRPAWAA